MVQTIKFSQFVGADLSQPTNTLVGLSGGQNAISLKVTEWFTSNRPTPFDGLFGYNLTLHKYEYYNGSIPAWVQLEAGSSSGTVSSVATGLGLTGGTITTTGTIKFAQIAPTSFWANTSLSTNYPLETVLVEGANIGISYSTGAITISAVNVGLIPWNAITSTSGNLLVNEGFIINNASQVSMLLPATAALGSVISIQGYGAGGWKITQNDGQNIQIGGVSSTVGTGGSVASVNRHNSLTLVCVVPNTTFSCLGGLQSSGLVIV